MRLKIAACLLAVMGFVGLAASPATAAPIALQLSDGTTTVTIFDGGLGDINPLDGAVTFAGAIGDWVLNVSTGSAGIGPVFMDLNSISATAAQTSSTLSILFSQVDVSTAFPGFQLLIGGTARNAAVVYSAFIDNTNAFFGGAAGLPFASLGPFGPGAFASTTAATVLATAPYSLTQAFFVTGNGSGDGSSFSANAELNPVPEPGSLALLGGGLLGLASWARRRRQQKKSA